MPFSDLPERLSEVRERIAGAGARGGPRPQVAVLPLTKAHGPEAVRAAWEAGVHDVGENRIQEALPKMEAVDVPVRWHLIGHLQRNKTRFLDGFAIVHALDSGRLADALNDVGVQRRRAVEALLQVN